MKLFVKLFLIVYSYYSYFDSYYSYVSYFNPLVNNSSELHFYCSVKALSNMLCNLEFEKQLVPPPLLNCEVILFISPKHTVYPVVATPYLLWSYVYE